MYNCHMGQEPMVTITEGSQRVHSPHEGFPWEGPIGGLEGTKGSNERLVLDACCEEHLDHCNSTRSQASFPCIPFFFKTNLICCILIVVEFKISS